jgi:sec-independent protein translocase protein TatB
MFNIGFSEILLIAVVALLVLGPERLPRAARFAGLWLRRARAQWNSVKAELENELADDELLRNIRKAHSELHDGLHAARELVEPASIKPAAIESTERSAARSDVTSTDG